MWHCADLWVSWRVNGGVFAGYQRFGRGLAFGHNNAAFWTGEADDEAITGPFGIAAKVTEENPIVAGFADNQGTAELWIAAATEMAHGVVKCLNAVALPAFGGAHLQDEDSLFHPLDCLGNLAIVLGRPSLNGVNQCGCGFQEVHSDLNSTSRMLGHAR